MIRPVTTEKEIPIHRFEPDGTPVYTDKINSHFIWDVDPEMCDSDCECRACYKTEKKNISSEKEGTKHSPPDHQKHAFYTASRQFSSPGTSDHPTEPTESSYDSPSSWETYSPDFSDSSHSTDHANYSDPDAVPDLSQIYLATRADPQPSTQTVDTSESSDETSEKPAPMVDEPPDQRPRNQAPPQKATNGPWFNFDDLAPRQWRKRMSEMRVWLDL
ncbi:hypothetical protein Ddye_021822 [Dipteronia dyeriana]|uniref:Uncharacterized protein n=1 Tax=Dipteronia dyeriana TaxID=168575 RepID=A0AAD9U2F8_9ROSI|nr:hypothetical protein Ddye_021822 [Dipteronia dyeriana]